MSEPTEAELLKKAAEEGRADNPELDPPDVAETEEVNDGDAD